jgi:uncharacterized protein (TIGR00255 family)
MTGFGFAEVEAEGVSIRVEIRAVNHRFLQVRQRVPVELGELEPKLEGMLRKKLARGAVNLNVNLTRVASPSAVDLDLEVAKRYRKLLAKASKELALANDVGLAKLIELPGVISQRADSGSRERDLKRIVKATATALAGLIEMREAEGARMEKDLRKHTKVIARLRKQIGSRMPKLVKAHQDGLRARVEELSGGLNLAETDLAREMALIADKTDVSEELSRLEAHLEALDDALAKGGSIGRQLDFLVQELYREANTIGSKAGDVEVAHAVVDLKTNIERVREQVQNVE